VSEIEVEEGPVISPDESVKRACEVMQQFDSTWVCVVNEGELLGWVDAGDLKGKDKVGDATPEKFGAYVTAESSLREALDSLITSETQVAAVVWEGQRYRGVLNLERISREILA